jgi:hypothetical protein
MAARDFVPPHFSCMQVRGSNFQTRAKATSWVLVAPTPKWRLGGFPTQSVLAAENEILYIPVHSTKKVCRDLKRRVPSR